MTAQIPEILIHQGQTFRLAAEPLRPWLSRRRHRHITFQPRTTACWRRYVGTWDIVGDKLCLVHISARFPDGTEVKLEDLFPDQPDRVFAEWVSGELRCPTGALLGYLHAGYMSVYEQDLFLQFEKGVLVGQRTVVNEPPQQRNREEWLGSPGDGA